MRNAGRRETELRARDAQITGPKVPPAETEPIRSIAFREADVYVAIQAGRALNRIGDILRLGDDSVATLRTLAFRTRGSSEFIFRVTS